MVRPANRYRWQVLDDDRDILPAPLLLLDGTLLLGPVDLDDRAFYLLHNRLRATLGVRAAGVLVSDGVDNQARTRHRFLDHAGLGNEWVLDRDLHRGAVFDNFGAQGHALSGTGVAIGVRCRRLS